MAQNFLVAWDMTVTLYIDFDTHDESSSKNMPPPTPTPPLLFLLMAKSIPPPLPLPNRTLLNLEQFNTFQDQLCLLK